MHIVHIVNVVALPSPETLTRMAELIRTAANEHRVKPAGFDVGQYTDIQDFLTAAAAICRQRPFFHDSHDPLLTIILQAFEIADEAPVSRQTASARLDELERTLASVQPNASMNDAFARLVRLADFLTEVAQVIELDRKLTAEAERKYAS